MKTPSINKLASVFTDAKLAKDIFLMSHSELSNHPVGAKRIAECFNPPKWHDVRLTILDSIEPGLYGVDCAETVSGEYADYLNAGDSYTPTIIFWQGNYRVQSIGDFIETMERRGVKFK